MKYVNLEQFNKMKLPHNGKEIERANELLKQVEQLYPAKLEINVDDSTDNLSFEKAEVVLIHNDLRISLQYDDYRKKYQIVSYPEGMLKNIDRHTVTIVKESLERPNEIGVLSAKKIVQWVEYYEAIYSRLYNVDQENGKEKALFMESIKGLSVRWWNDKKTGEVIKNGIRLSFTIRETYVSTKMEINYDVPITIESFKKLADNKYKPVR